LFAVGYGFEQRTRPTPFNDERLKGDTKLGRDVGHYEPFSLGGRWEIDDALRGASGGAGNARRDLIGALKLRAGFTFSGAAASAACDDRQDAAITPSATRVLFMIAGGTFMSPS
jgi:hypothetical protein